MVKGNPEETAKVLTSGLPGIYANGFNVSTSVADVSIILMRHNQPFTVLSLSFTSAKTLAQGLTQAILEFEALTKTSITTIDEFKEKVKASGERKGEQSPDKPKS